MQTACNVQADRCFDRTSSSRVLHALLNFPNVKHPSTWGVRNKEKLCSLLTTINYTRDLQEYLLPKGYSSICEETRHQQVGSETQTPTHIAGLVLVGDLYRLNAKLITEQPPRNLLLIASNKRTDPRWSNMLKFIQHFPAPLRAAVYFTMLSYNFSENKPYFNYGLTAVEERSSSGVWVNTNCCFFLS